MPKMAARVIIENRQNGYANSFVAVHNSEFFKEHEYIFECETPGCLGCGCPVFTVQDQHFPDEIYTWLDEHAQWCAVRFTAPSPD